MSVAVSKEDGKTDVVTGTEEDKKGHQLKLGNKKATQWVITQWVS